jgi:hypothetical protein
MNRGIYSSWEIQHGYNSDHFLKGEASRVGEYEIKRRAETKQQPASSAPAPSKLEQKLLSHSQWTVYNRKVCVPDSQAKSVVVTKTGHRLSLFGLEQTKEKI